MKISEYQQLVADRIKTFDGLSGVPVLTEIKGDVANEVDLIISKLGLCILVLTPTMRNDSPDHPAINLNIDLVVQVSENPAINRSPGGTMQPGVDVALLVAQNLHRTEFSGAKFNRLNFEGLELVEEPQSIAYQILFNTRTKLNA